GTGYVGRQFASELSRRGRTFVAPARADFDYGRFESLLAWLQEHRPEFVVNAAGSTGKPNVDACEDHKAETLSGNTLLPQTVAHACASAGVPWGHVSSGCIFDGANIVQPDGSVRVEKDLTRPDIRKLLLAQPEAVRGFSEDDVPNFSFRQPPCSFYSGT